MRENNVLGMLFVKHLLGQIPSVTLLADMTGPVCTDTDGTVLTAYSRLVRQDQFTVEAFEQEFANHKVAMYMVVSTGIGWKTGDTVMIVDKDLDLVPTTATQDVPEGFLIRFAKVPK